MGVQGGSITTDIIRNGLIFNMDPANRASYPKTGTTINDTIGSDTGTLNGITFQDINRGVFNFDGNDDNIVTAQFVGISSSQPRTMSVLIKGGSTNNGKNWPMAVAFGAGSTNRAMWIGGGASPSAYWYFGFWGSPSATSGDLDSGIRMDADDNWHLLTSIYNEITQVAKGYIDGVEVVSGNRPSINTGSSSLVIGKHLTQSTYWEGYISNVHIYNRALSASEVLHNYNALKGRFGL